MATASPGAQGKTVCRQQANAMRGVLMFKSKGPLVWIILSAVTLIIALVLFLTTGSTEWSGHWEFTF